MAAKNSRLRRELNDSQANLATLGAAGQAYEEVNGCLDAIIAAFNSITFQSQMYDAYLNVTQSPACSNVISTGPRDW